MRLTRGYWERWYERGEWVWALSRIGESYHFDVKNGWEGEEDECHAAENEEAKFVWTVRTMDSREWRRMAER